MNSGLEKNRQNWGVGMRDSFFFYNSLLYAVFMASQSSTELLIPFHAYPSSQLVKL